MSTPAAAPAQAGTVTSVVEIAAPPERVFAAITDPDELAAWCGSGETFRTRDWLADPRPGGLWSAGTTGPGGEEGTLRGRFLAVDPPRLLELTWENGADGFAPGRVRYELEPAVVDGLPGTRLTVTHTRATALPTACLANLSARAWNPPSLRGPAPWRRTAVLSPES